MALPQLLGPSLLSSALPTQLQGGRLTLDNTGKLPVPTADQTGKTAVWLVPYTGRACALWNSTVSAWQLLSIPDAGVSVNLGTLTSGATYDVFGYNNSGSVALELSAAWTTAGGATAARSTALTLTDGVYTKSGDKTRLYLGTFYTTATTTTEDSAARRYLWNTFNRVPRRLWATDPTVNHTYTTATWRAFDNNTTDGQGRVCCVIGLNEQPVQATFSTMVNNGNNLNCGCGIGLDSTSTVSSDIYGFQVVTGGAITTFAFYNNTVGIGQHFLQSLEYSTATGTTTWYTVVGAAPVICNFGLLGTVIA